VLIFAIGFELVVKPLLDVHHVSSENAPDKKNYDTQAITPRLYKEIPYIPLRPLSTPPIGIPLASRRLIH
jgi:hypothetical protein